jgi:DNA replication and repair protein RecF
MPVRDLSLRGYRSYASLDLRLAGGVHVVAGPNAAGKTNLLEALVVLSRGRSHRGAPDAELVSWGHGFARLEASVEPEVGAPGSAQRLEVVLGAAGSGARKRVLVNGVPRRATALGGTLRSVVFAPEDMLLVVGPPSLRRGVLDDLILERVPQAASTLAEYGRALSQRNALLRRIREGGAEPAELLFWDGVVCEAGGRILEWRAATLADLAGPLREAHGAIAPAEASLELRYLSNASPAEWESPADALRRRLAETSEKEVWNGATLVGPHRDDVVFVSGDRALAAFASRGQQRSAILALKLAVLDLLTAHDGRPPLLLLDDVFSELDPERRAHLIRRIAMLPQAIVTTTSLDDIDPSLLAIAEAWHVEAGRVASAVASGGRR